MKNNIEIVLRERGKVVASRSSHNIWTASGKTWLGHLVTYASWDPDTLWEDNRLRYMGFGIGGRLQTDLMAFTPPLSVDFPGTNEQTNMSDSVISLERPVPFDNTLVYYRQFDSVELIGTYHLRFTVYVGLGDISFAHVSIPLSEISLHNNSIDPYAAAGQPAMAYDVLDPLRKSNLHDMTVRWTVRL